MVKNVTNNYRPNSMTAHFSKFNENAVLLMNAVIVRGDNVETQFFVINKNINFGYSI